MKDVFGNAVSLTLAGESHGKAIIAVLFGFPAVNSEKTADSLQNGFRVGFNMI